MKKAIAKESGKPKTQGKMAAPTSSRNRTAQEHCVEIVGCADSRPRLATMRLCCLPIP